VVPNPIQPLAGVSADPARRRKTVLSVGRLATVKRHDLLIECWSKLRTDFPDWELRIFGDGPRRRTLEILVQSLELSESVKLMGITAEIQAEYLSASILCHPAEFEGFPLVVGEALAAGLPVVGFADCSGLNHLVKDSINGLLISPQDRREGLTAALRKLMSDDHARRGMSAAAPGSVAEYAPDKVYDQWESVIKESLHDRQAVGRSSPVGRAIAATCRSRFLVATTTRRRESDDRCLAD
jgi:glycosyltransferase involved in cell wall biosynthesis